MTGLVFPHDLQAWRRWQQRREGLVRLAREAKQRLRPREAAPALLWLPPQTAHALVVIDHDSPSCRRAILDPLQQMDLTKVAVITRSRDVGVPQIPNAQWHVREYVGVHQIPAGVEEVLSLGGYLSLSEPIEEWARQHDVRFSVVQHGLLTPWAPPLGAGTHLLAWSQQDADFWTHGRSDLTAEVVGSQMLWLAAQEPDLKVVSERPIMLGQLHGTELSKREMLSVYTELCRDGDIDYRPHPNEKDAFSRAGHAWMRRQGVHFADPTVPLTSCGRPVISIFSTGTLEAAQRGLPAWVHHPRPPHWVREFWSRYGLSQFGQDPTPRMETGQEPAGVVADVLGL